MGEPPAVSRWPAEPRGTRTTAPPACETAVLAALHHPALRASPPQPGWPAATGSARRPRWASSPELTWIDYFYPLKVGWTCHESLSSRVANASETLTVSSGRPRLPGGRSVTLDVGGSATAAGVSVPGNARAALRPHQEGSADRGPVGRARWRARRTRSRATRASPSVQGLLSGSTSTSHLARRRLIEPGRPAPSSAPSYLTRDVAGHVRGAAAERVVRRRPCSTDDGDLPRCAAWCAGRHDIARPVTNVAKGGVRGARLHARSPSSGKRAGHDDSVRPRRRRTRSRSNPSGPVRLPDELRSLVASRRRRRARRRPRPQRRVERSTPRTNPLVGTPVPAVTTTCSTSGTWLTEVPRTRRTPSAMPFMPCR